jgi:hypothetical protein
MDGEPPGKGYQCLAAYRRCVERINTAWPGFLSTRSDRLRHGGESEKVAEAILEDLFIGVLDWLKGDITSRRIWSTADRGDQRCVRQVQSQPDRIACSVG